MREIPLTRGLVALVDDTDYELVAPYKWRATYEGRRVYAITNIRSAITSTGKTNIRMHNLIMRCKGIDHRDLDGLNNQRSNLRIATQTQNNANQEIADDNKSGFKGVSLHSQTKRWRATIQYEGKHMSLGYYDNPVLAAFAYDTAAREMFGVFARPNFEWSSDESRFPEVELTTT